MGINFAQDVIPFSGIWELWKVAEINIHRVMNFLRFQSSLILYNEKYFKLQSFEYETRAEKRNTKDAYMYVYQRKMESTRACNLSFASIFRSPRGPKLWIKCSRVYTHTHIYLYIFVDGGGERENKWEGEYVNDNINIYQAAHET